MLAPPPAHCLPDWHALRHTPLTRYHSPPSESQTIRKHWATQAPPTPSFPIFISQSSEFQNQKIA